MIGETDSGGTLNTVPNPAGPERSAQLDELVVTGGRNDWLFRQGGRLRAEGLEFEAIFTELDRLNLTHCLPQLSAVEVRGIAKSVCRYPAGHSVRRYIDLSDFLVAYMPDGCDPQLAEAVRNSDGRVGNRYLRERLHCATGSVTPRLEAYVTSLPGWEATLGTTDHSKVQDLRALDGGLIYGEYYPIPTKRILVLRAPSWAVNRARADLRRMQRAVDPRTRDWLARLLKRPPFPGLLLRLRHWIRRFGWPEVPVSNNERVTVGYARTRAAGLASSGHVAAAHGPPKAEHGELPTYTGRPCKRPRTVDGQRVWLAVEQRWERCGCTTRFATTRGGHVRGECVMCPPPQLRWRRVYVNGASEQVWLASMIVETTSTVFRRLRTGEYRWDSTTLRQYRGIVPA